MSTTTVPTTALQPGDEMVSRETWGTIYDLVESVELPEAPAVAAKVHIVRTTVVHDSDRFANESSVRSERTFFYAGVKATHTVDRPYTPRPWPKTPTMSRAQFEYLARILFEASREEAIEGPMTVERMVGKFAYHLADTNARFDRERFIAAATA